MTCSTQVPDYYQIVKDPINLQDIVERIEEDSYESSQDFVNDIALLFENADLYNKVGLTLSKENLLVYLKYDMQGFLQAHFGQDSSPKKSVNPPRLYSP